MKHNYANPYVNKMIMRLDRMILLRNTCNVSRETFLSNLTLNVSRETFLSNLTLNVSRETYYIYLTGNAVKVKLFVKTDRFKNLKADEIKAV